MSKIDKSLSELFGVDPIYGTSSGYIQESIQSTELQVIDPEQRAMEVITDPDATDMEQDIAMIRNNMHSLLREGQEAFGALIHIAKAEERVSAFEVCNAYLANLTDMNMKLLSLHERKKKMKGAPDKKDSGIVTNAGGTTNIAFVGTTKELLEQIKKNNKEQ